MNEQLRLNQTYFQQEIQKMKEQFDVHIKRKDKEMDELKEQLRDVMFYIDGQQKLKEMSDLSKDELESSQVVVTSPSDNSTGASSTSSNRTQRRRRKLYTAVQIEEEDFDLMGSEVH
ncbi:unnamed protein product [Didymodactylos carnosus]|uniref:Uncharacterized protein n=1 Tax=Didymodactylos carnosus TaxID=1234261 RepID=A0A8S2FC44_9BILA|nr:unnamed protein product [Didymodactylos carnosus]CAF4217777.1 unnamed protein product [Didymodactylos carnosus]